MAAAHVKLTEAGRLLQNNTNKPQPLDADLLAHFVCALVVPVAAALQRSALCR